MKRGVQSEDINKNFWTLTFYCLWHFSILDHCSEQVLQLTEPGSDQSQTVSPAPSDRWTLTAQTESPAPDVWSAALQQPVQSARGRLERLHLLQSRLTDWLQHLTAFRRPDIFQAE